jgi:hypothetical protein
MKLITTLLLACAAAGLSPSASAQTPITFGRWGPANGGLQLYVQPGGTGSGTRSAPLPSITAALAIIHTTTTNPLQPFSINVLPGIYSVASGETFPLDLPAYGVSIEATDDGLMTPPVWILQGTSLSTDLIDVTKYFSTAAFLTGNPAFVLALLLPPSQIQGLTIQGGHRGVHVEPSVNILPGDTITTFVEIRDCDINHNRTGVRVLTNPGRRSEVVVEHNYIHENGEEGVGIGLELVNTGGVEGDVTVSSCLVRANRIWDNALANVVISNTTGDASFSQDRLFSNFIDLSPLNVVIVDAAPRLANNTIANAFSTASVTGLGISYSNAVPNGVLWLLNNIVWNPLVADITTAGTFLTKVDRNDFNNGPFIGTLTNFSLLPPFTIGAPAPEDLHLQAIATTPAIWSGGEPSYVRTGPVGGATIFDAAMTMMVGGSPVRIDVPIDVDTDPRILQVATEGFLLDIGADEVSSPGAAATLGSLLQLNFVSTTPAAGFDRWGNLTTPGGTGTGTLTVSHPAGSTAVLALCPVFTSPSLVTNPNPAIDANTIVVPLGNCGLELNSSVVFVTGTPVNPNLTSFTLTLPGAGGSPEAEIYMQAIVTPPGGPFLSSGWLSNRLRMEIDP